MTCILSEERCSELATEAMRLHSGGLHDSIAAIVAKAANEGAAEQVKWVSVDERLPDGKDFYLTAEGDNVRVAFFVKGSWIGPISESRAITHWMPLIPPPAKG